MLPREILPHIFNYLQEYWYSIQFHTLLSITKVNKNIQIRREWHFIMYDENDDEYWIIKFK